MTFGFSQENEMVEIETNDGNIFLGQIVEKSSLEYKLKTQDGIIISVPFASVKRLSKIETAEDGAIFVTKPNGALQKSQF
tara:strand:- start:1634 stop:1873 length:240 start_codon:yes stop_codon:yes gene_type:complete